MINKLFTKDSVIEMINAGKNLVLAGDENVLNELPTGSWIAGTIPYFMDEKGGISSTDSIFVTELPDYVKSASVKVYTPDNIQNIYSDSPNHGFSIVIIPASSSVHLSFALDSHNYDDFAAKPLIGWISGVMLDDLGKVKPKVFDGLSKQSFEDAAVVFNIELPENKNADIGIINVFNQGDGDTITFTEDGFSAKDVFVNGKKINFVDYLKDNEINLQLPLVADMYGAMINTSFQGIDEDAKQVNFYAPVFKGVSYKIAGLSGDYVDDFNKIVSQENVPGEIFFSCNCILNYLYANLEGKNTGTFTGPITFGEIAYQLLNQTLAYVSIEDI